MDWNKLRTFHAVVQSGSFAKASALVNLSQSAVSRQVADLEFSLKNALFNRHSRGLTLTEAGEVLFQTTEEVIGRLKGVEDQLRSKVNSISGTLRIATTHALGSIWLIAFLKEFLEVYPDLQLTIIGNDEELDLNVRQADVAIRTALPHHNELTQFYLMTCHLELYASQRYLDRFGVPKTSEDLDHHRLIVFGHEVVRPYENVNWLLHVGLRPGQKARTPYLRINSSHGLRRCAESGLGIIAASREYILEEGPSLVRVLPDIEGPSVDLYYVLPRALQKIKRFTALGEFLKEKLKLQERKI